MGGPWAWGAEGTSVLLPQWAMAAVTVTFPAGDTRYEGVTHGQLGRGVAEPAGDEHNDIP